MAAVDSNVHRQAVATAMDIGVLQADVRSLGDKVESTHAHLTEKIKEYRDLENLRHDELNRRHEELMKRLDERHSSLVILLTERSETTRGDLQALSDSVNTSIPALTERVDKLEKQQARIQWIGGAVVAVCSVLAWLWEHVLPRVLPALLAFNSTLLMGC